jgi:hypothetical protein
VEQQRGRAGEVDHDLPGQQSCAGDLGEALAQKSRLPVITRRAPGVRNAAHSHRDAIGQGLPQLVIADPRIEQIAEKIDARRIAGRTRAERIERFGQHRPRRRQVQIGQEQRGLYQTSSARSITTSLVGTFWWKPLLAVATPLIWSTTSCPAVTRPNTQ